MRRGHVLKLLGLAGLAGVAAGSAVLARNERQRRAYTPDDVRARLHERHQQLEAVPEPVPVTELVAGQHRTGRRDTGEAGQSEQLPQAHVRNVAPCARWAWKTPSN